MSEEADNVISFNLPAFTLAWHTQPIKDFQEKCKEMTADKAQKEIFAKYPYAAKEWSEISMVRKYLYENFGNLFGFATQFMQIFGKDDLIETLIDKVLGHIEKKFQQDKTRNEGKDTARFVLTLGLPELCFFVTVITAVDEYRTVKGKEEQDELSKR
jgi:hypothetical protein